MSVNSEDLDLEAARVLSRTLPALERAERGAAQLDIVRPDWWRNSGVISLGRIDLDRLNIEDPNRCVLGQVFGSYIGGLKELGIGARWQLATLHGFCPRAAEDYRPLTHTWRTLITSRRAAA